jgi:hypothetical protein
MIASAFRLIGLGVEVGVEASSCASEACVDRNTPDRPRRSVTKFQEMIQFRN